MLRSIGDAVITTDAMMCVTYLNPIAENLTGWQTAEAQGLHVDRIFNICSADDGKSALNAIIKSFSEAPARSSKSYSMLIRKTDSKQFDIENSVAPIRNKEGSVIGAVMAFHAITERRKAEELLRDSRMCAENALNIAKLDTFEWNFASDRLNCSARAKEMFEFSKNEGNSLTEYFKRIDPEDRSEFLGRWTLQLAGKERFIPNTEYFCQTVEFAISSVWGHAKRAER